MAVSLRLERLSVGSVDIAEPLLAQPGDGSVFAVAVPGVLYQAFVFDGTRLVMQLSVSDDLSRLLESAYGQVLASIKPTVRKVPVRKKASAKSVVK